MFKRMSEFIYQLLLQPFAEFAFMRRALIACAALSLSGSAIGVFLVLRRMTLIGDSISHAIMPGASLAFMLVGFSLIPMTIGGLLAGITIASLAALVAKLTNLNEDASFTGTHLLCLSAGIMMISVNGSNLDLMHILFGNILAVDWPTLFLVGVIASINLLIISWCYRLLVLECADPVFLSSLGINSGIPQQLFMCVLVLNLVAGFHALGTLMALGLLILPAIASFFWGKNIDTMIIIAFIIAIFSSYCGLLLSYHANLPSGPAIVFIAGVVYVISLLLGANDSVRSRYLQRQHLTG
jgi:zinc/manganese transport system permease protein